MTSKQGGAQQPAGIRDVARKVGVSVATVSFALNGQPGVSEDTRHRILAAAAELGYRANPQAQALRRGRTTTYGLVIRNFNNPFFLEVLGGAEQAADEAGAALLLLDSHYSLERERMLVREMAAQRLAGLAIAPVGKGESVLLWQELRPGTPVVALNAPRRASPACRGSTPITRSGSDWPCAASPNWVTPASRSCPHRAAWWQTRTGSAISGASLANSASGRTSCTRP